MNIGALLVEVSLDHGDGCWWMATDLAGGEVRPCGEVSAIESSSPCGEGWGEKGGVVKFDAASNSGVGGEKGV